MLDRVPAALCVALMALWMIVSAVEMARAETGIASVYGTERGQTRTATGERYTGMGMTCASKTARLGSYLRVTNLRSGHSIVCRCNDRGPFVRGRIIDLSIGAARVLGVHGLARARVE